MREFVIVHNIPAPYRLHLFKVMSERLAARDIHLRVDFMAAGHAERPHWGVQGKQLPFDHRYWKDVGPFFEGHEWHLNPSLLVELWRRRPDYLMVNGPWASITSLLLSPLPPAKRSTIAWIEAQSRTPGRMQLPLKLLKGSLLRRFDHIAMPGSEGLKFLELLYGRPDGGPKVAMLPNIVDETRFRDEKLGAQREELRRDLGVEPGTRMALWNARLIRQKGVPDILKMLTAEDLKGWTVVILGDGPEKDQVLAAISERGLAPAVKLVSYQPYERMPAIYHAADLLLLPSLHDPNPLSIVEAMHAKLPLLVSNRLGNHPEAIREGVNGWSVDPVDPVSVREGIRKAFQSDEATLRRMGEAGHEHVMTFWASGPAVDRFLDAVLSG